MKVTSSNYAPKWGFLALSPYLENIELYFYMFIFYLLVDI